LSARILLVEDDRELRATLRSALEVEGYVVMPAASLADAQALWRHALEQHAAPELVLLDLGLPDGDGQDFLLLLRKQAGVPVVVISAREAEGQKIRLLDAGADDYPARVKVVVASFMQPAAAYLLLSSVPRRSSRVRD